MNIREFDQAYDRLISWAKSLVKVAEDDRADIRETLLSKHCLPANCPSRESLALAAYGPVKTKFHEVKGAVADIENAIFED